MKRLGLIYPLLLSAAIGMDGFGGLWRTRVSGQETRNNPDREKTPADLAAIAAAEAKRQRKNRKATQ